MAELFRITLGVNEPRLDEQAPGAARAIVDPGFWKRVDQLGQQPAASILKVIHQKPIAEVDDQTLILADQAGKAVAQMEQEVGELLADKYPVEKAQELAKLMTSGTWTHDYPITYERALALGLHVNDKIPDNMLHLMQLYPQPTRRQPSVEYLPLPYRSGRPTDRPSS